MFICVCRGESGVVWRRVRTCVCNATVGDVCTCLFDAMK